LIRGKTFNASDLQPVNAINNYYQEFADDTYIVSGEAISDSVCDEIEFY